MLLSPHKSYHLKEKNGAEILSYAQNFYLNSLLEFCLHDVPQMDISEGDRHEVVLPHKKWHLALTKEPNLLTEFFISDSAIEVQNS